MKDGKVKQVFSRNGYQWEEGGHKKRMNEREFAGCILYSYWKIE
jgi:hypothetical protein